MQEFTWWGGNNPPGENLKTKKQLNEIRLKPVEPVGVIRTPKYDCFLYDPENPASVRPKRKLSEKQKAALEKLAEANRKRQYQIWWEENLSREFFDKWWSEAYCKKWMLKSDNWVILDTETTGLECAEIVEISIINHKKEVLLDTLIKPTITIPDDAIAIHRITNEMVANAPTLLEIWQQLTKITKSKELVIYNADFDLSILKYCRQLHELPKLKYKSSACLMAIYSQWFGEWSDYWEDYRWQPLCGGHRALSDCYAAYNLIEKMATSEELPEFPYPEYASKYERERLQKLINFLVSINQQ